MSERKHPLETVAELDEGAIKSLDDDLRGDLILPDNEEYEDARNVWNGLINKYPAVITRVKGATDVATAIQFAHENDLETSIRGGAHHQAGSAICRDERPGTPTPRGRCPTECQRTAASP